MVAMVRSDLLVALALAYFQAKEMNGAWVARPATEESSAVAVRMVMVSLVVRELGVVKAVGHTVAL
jgi:hypothetical protein